MTEGNNESLLSPQKTRKVNNGIQKLRESLSEQTPSVLLLLALLFGIVAGVVAYVYSKYFELLLWVVWEVIPRKLVQPLLERGVRKHGWFPEVDKVAWIYTVSVAVVFGGLAGLTQRILGSPGDLPETIKYIHKCGAIPLRQAPSMFICSAFSIVAGGSLGPEAALLSLCGAAVSFVAKQGLGYRNKELRNCAIMGMTAGLAAFFGVALGGSLFALEVLHRQGLQFFEIAIFGIACGTICLVVYRGLSLMPFGQVWTFPIAFPVVDYRHVLVGVLIGVATAMIAVLFMQLHKHLNLVLLKMGFHEHHTPVRSGLLGGLLIGILGVLIPPTMFWGEFEIQTLADPSRRLPHIWPSGGIHGLEPFLGGHYSPGWYMIIAVAKLFAVSITVLSGFRGGFIFPLFLVGTSLGEAVQGFHIPFISGLPPVLLAMCFAAGLNTAITRTPLATPLILSILAGTPQVLVPCLAASITALFATINLPFIKTQQDRTDFTFHEVVLYDADGDAFAVDPHDVHRLSDNEHEALRSRSNSLAREEHTGELPAVGGV